MHLATLPSLHLASRQHRKSPWMKTFTPTLSLRSPPSGGSAAAANTAAFQLLLPTRPLSMPPPPSPATSQRRFIWLIICKA